MVEVEIRLALIDSATHVPVMGAYRALMQQQAQQKPTVRQTTYVHNGMIHNLHLRSN